MSRERILLQGLQAKLAKLLAWVQRATYATSARIETAPSGTFSVYIEWKEKDGSTKSYRHQFTREYVFGSSLQGSVRALSVRKCATDFAKDVVREVIERRVG